jgi:Xaa-Pro aminopeptidase
VSGRLDRCRALFARLRVDGVLVTDPEDVRYLSGFRGDDATLVVEPTGAVLCTDARYWEQVH